VDSGRGAAHDGRLIADILRAWRQTVRGDARRLRAVQDLFAALAPSLGLGVSIRLRDGSLVPLGPKVSGSGLALAIAAGARG
jgi:hypothetical protein